MKKHQNVIGHVIDFVKKISLGHAFTARQLTIPSVLFIILISLVICSPE